MLKIISISASLVALLLSATACAFASTSQNVSGVIRVSNGSAGTGLAATQFSSDPGLNAYPGYALAVTSAGVTNGYVGINLPTLHQGYLPNIGNFVECQFNFEVPTGSPPPGNGLRMVLQTQDGYYHVSTSFYEHFGNGPFSTPNPSIQYYVYNWAQANFSPPVGAEPATKLALVFYGSATCLQIAPFFQYELGTTTELNTDPGSAAANLLTTLVPTDSNFNFELNSLNN